MGWLKNLFSKSESWSRPIPCGWWARWAAEVAQYDGYRTLIYTGEGLRGREHAQARAKINGTWEWLSVRGGRLEIADCEIKMQAGLKAGKPEKVRADTPSIFWACNTVR